MGTRPSVQQMMAALQHDMFLYFGHGSGEQYLQLGAMDRLARCAGSLLMGCSSGRLRLHGLYEPAGSPWAYLLAGEGHAACRLLHSCSSRVGSVVVVRTHGEVRACACACARGMCESRPALTGTLCCMCPLHALPAVCAAVRQGLQWWLQTSGM